MTTQPKLLPDALELCEITRAAWQPITDRITASGVPTALEGKSLADKLKAIEANLKQARAERPALVKARDDARDAFASTEVLSPNSPEFKSAGQAIAALGAKDDEIADLTAAQVGVLRMMGETPGPGSLGTGAPPQGDATGWDVRAALADETTRARLVEVSSTTMDVGRVKIGQVASREAMAAAVGADANMRRGDYLGVLPQLRRALSILDLIPTGVMDGQTLPYTVEGGTFDTAAETTEGAMKPEANVTFTPTSADAATIAHWTQVQKQSLADFAAMQTIIEGRLRYGVLRRLENAILAGSGTSPAMRGILNTSGIGAIGFTTGALVADQVLEGLTSILLADAEANAVVLNPIDWKNALKAKAAGDGHYYSGGPYSSTPQVMWGVPLIPSRAITQGTALVGDFAIGAQLFIREGVHVLLSDSDQDDFVRNMCKLLAEMRAALAVFRPTAFTTVALQ